MAKETKSLLSVIMWIVGVLVSVAVGGLFLDGSTTSNPILGFLPQVIHSIVGWIVIVGTLLGVVMVIVDAVNK